MGEIRRYNEEDFSQGLDYPDKDAGGFDGLVSGENPDYEREQSNENELTAQEQEENLETIENQDKFDRLFISVEDAIPGLDMNNLSELKVDMEKTNSARFENNIISITTAEKFKNEDGGLFDGRRSEFGVGLPADYAQRLWGKMANGLNPRGKRTEDIRKAEGREAIQNLDCGTLVDLGAGADEWGYRIGLLLKAKNYVAVEPHNLQFLIPRLTDVITDKPLREKLSEEDIEQKDKMKIAVVQEDMLNFLKRIPDKSVVILCSAIDDEVIPDANARREIGKEIDRVSIYSIVDQSDI